MAELMFGPFASLQVGKYAEYYILSNKYWISNKRCPLNAALIGIVTIFY